MIESTFLHLPAVGKTTEAGLWRAGVRTWHDFLDRPKVARFTTLRKERADTVLRQSQRALARGESAYFCRLPRPEHWRLWHAFKDEALFVDIETDWHHAVTVLGVYDGQNVVHLIRGKNLHAQAVRQALGKAKLLVTYNGASFDLPVLRRVFGDVVPAVPHLDLLHPSRRLGYRGGLKALERSVGIRRPDSVEGMSGEDALRLWDLYRASGEHAYLQRLLDYNEEDIANLPRVAEVVVREAERALRTDSKL